MVTVSTSSRDIISYPAWLKFTCDTNKINLIEPIIQPDNWLFSNLLSYINIVPPANKSNPKPWEDDKIGKDKNNPSNPSKEAPRLLTHLIFDPIYKPALSTYYLTYTLDIEVNRTIEHNLNYHYIFNQNFTDSKVIDVIHNLNTSFNVHVFVNDVLINPTTITNTLDDIKITLDEPMSGIVKLYDDISLDSFTHNYKDYIFEYEQYEHSNIWTIYHYLELNLQADIFINGIKTIPVSIDNTDKNKMVITFKDKINGIAKLF